MEKSGFGIQRCFHATMEIYKDEHGINFPASIRPFDVSVIVMNPEDDNQMRKGVRCYDALIGTGKKTVLDDRHGKTLKEKVELSDFYGIPVKLVIGRKEAQTDSVTIKQRENEEGKLVTFEPQIVEAYLNG